MKFMFFIAGIIFLASCGGTDQNSSLDPIKNDTAQASIQLIYETPYVKECFYSDLSTNFDFSVKIVRYSYFNESNDSCNLLIQIIDKKSKEIKDSIFMTSFHFRKTSFNDCYMVPSFTTGIDTSGMSIYYEHGPDWLIADLNFDNLEDIAVMNNWGEGKGVRYNFYIQDEDHQFTLDTFLTNTVKYFPLKINIKERSLLTVVVDDYRECAFLHHLYKLDSETNMWKEAHRERISTCQ